MIFDLQKASIWKRASALLLDAILLAILAAGFMFAISAITDFDSVVEKYNQNYEEYTKKYPELADNDTEAFEKKYETFTEDEKQAYLELYNATDHSYKLMQSLLLVILSIGILLAYVALEFVLPLYLKNGQTIGKKIFGIALIRPDGVRITTLMLFVRTILGKYTLETMIPVLIILMILSGSLGILGVAILLLIPIMQIILLVSTQNNSAIHDVLAVTVAVDMASQMIFDTPEEKLEYQKRIHADSVSRQEYP